MNSKRLFPSRQWRHPRALRMPRAAAVCFACWTAVRPGNRNRPDRTEIGGTGGAHAGVRHPDTADGCIRHRGLSARSADPAARGCGGKARRAVRPGDRARDPEAMPRAPADRDRDIRDRGPVAGAPRAGGTGRRKSIPGGGRHRSFGHAAIEHGPRKAAALHDCAKAGESRAGSAALWLVLNSRDGGRSARGVTDGRRVWFVREGDPLPGDVRIGRIATRPPGVQIEGGDDSALPYRPRPGDGS